jgi:hypothetical protein
MRLPGLRSLFVAAIVASGERLAVKTGNAYGTRAPARRLFGCRLGEPCFILSYSYASPVGPALLVTQDPIRSSALGLSCKSQKRTLMGHSTDPCLEECCRLRRLERILAYRPV